MNGYTFDLSNRVILVTGASSGIGRHFALQMAASGGKVAIAARRADLLDDLRDQITGAGGKAIAVTMDVADETSSIAAFDEVESQLGPVDTVIANAGMNIAGSTLGIGADDFDRVLAVNLRGVFLTAREGARRMIAAGSPETSRGRIILISSITAHHVSAGMAAYSATKAAVLQMGKVMAKDWARKGINVNVLCPGYMRTEINDEMWDMERGKSLLAGFSRQRLMSIAALDPMMLYLASDASAEVTGSVFTIDDGQTL
jgi:NAD(P)-dependent dehydrogenase (short-subunit alcohol dehydrogenase family)